MPNGGEHHCGNCHHFIRHSSKCSLRNVGIESSHWTSCNNFNRHGDKVIGPIYAIVCEVKSGTGGYDDIPYFNGCRVDTLQRTDGGDTFVCFTDRKGKYHEFTSVADYIKYYRENSHDELFTRLQIPRERARRLGQEMVEILNAGHYVTSSGVNVNIVHQVEKAVNGTISYPPEKDFPTSLRHSQEMLIAVCNETTLTAVSNLISKGYDPAALNFASATSPGGGFLNGSRAQEEYLTRSSALWSCLRSNAMYAYHRTRKDPFYSDYVIYSPDVPILRNDDGELLETPYSCSVITSPAVHALGVRRYMPERVGDIESVMWKRILKVLAVAADHGHKAIVLGAWGCGAFGNDGDTIAMLFRKALEDNFHGAFERVVFAITDWSDERRFIGPFEKAFEGGEIVLLN
jgi:uncharacterized protein (TIGR02452 family)